MPLGFMAPSPSVFHPAPPPSQEDVQAVVQQAAKHIVRFLQKRGLIALATAPKTKGRLCAEQWGFNLHAATRVHGNDKQGREHLCRYILRPPFANPGIKTQATTKKILAAMGLPPLPPAAAAPARAPPCMSFDDWAN
jgi:hypothetical protein